MARMRSVAVLIETSRAYGRGLIRGVAQYNREHGQWAIYFEPHGLDEPPPTWLKNWKGDGILARVPNRAVANAVLKTGLPVVDLRGALTGLPMASIGVNNRMVAQLAFDHLAERGLRYFAFCGLPRGEYIRMDERCDHFMHLAEAAGFSCEVFQASRPRGRRKTWDEEQKTLAKWIKSLRKPIGIMACNDDRGLNLLDACRRAGAIVPEQVAVISVDNDEYLCNLSMPPMSSIDIAAQAIGYEAASILDGMMDGGPLPYGTRLIPPGGIIIRQSTEVLATEDPAVIQAVKLIRARACQRIRVADVTQHVAMSRVALEQRLKAVLGRTIHQEIRRVQVESVKELLADRALSLKQIARRCGFKYPQYMATVFRQVTGQTLSQFRDRVADRFLG
jgi:LacI family transcriptional regulator